MHFSFSSPLGTAMLIGLATHVLAVPTAPVASVVPEPVPSGVEPQIVRGTLLTESEASLHVADTVDSELVFSFVSVDEDGHVSFDVDTDDTDTSPSLNKRSYVATCNNCYITGTELQKAIRCDCRNKAGQWGATALNLNHCLANVNGQLQWRRNGNFGNSCQGGYLENNRYFRNMCTTYPNGPLYWTNAINLDERIHNWDGVLACTP